MITRFAPSPTGPLHLGHAYSAMLGFDMAMENGGDWLLRIEDIDGQRCRPEWEKQIYEDLEWLGLWWPEPVMRQSERSASYAAALDRLWQGDFLYPCTCTRRDIAEAASAPQEQALPVGPDGLVYPRICPEAFHGLPCSMSPRPSDVALRLAMWRTEFTAITDVSGPHWSFTETGPDHAGIISFTPQEMATDVGDIVLSRRGLGTSYHLSAVIDDAAQGITHVIRGADLFDATKIHVVLQHLLGLPIPIYHHHRLIRDENGKRLAKRDDARAIRLYRQEGATPQDIRRMVGL
jgi:glutamyl-Q tRNA(Asp) synthetase